MAELAKGLWQCALQGMDAWVGMGADCEFRSPGPKTEWEKPSLTK